MEKQKADELAAIAACLEELSPELRRALIDVLDFWVFRELEKYTCAVECMPNSPDKWVVRLVGERGILDRKPLNTTSDIFGFGRHFYEAAQIALQKRSSS